MKITLRDASRLHQPVTEMILVHGFLSRGLLGNLSHQRPASARLRRPFVRAKEVKHAHFVQDRHRGANRRRERVLCGRVASCGRSVVGSYVDEERAHGAGRDLFTAGQRDDGEGAVRRAQRLVVDGLEALLRRGCWGHAGGG